MSVIPTLKKKLKSIEATEKLSKAMKTVSAAKLSKLSALYKTYSQYAEPYSVLVKSGENTAENTSDCVMVIGSNRGFCGAFNSETANYFKENFPSRPKTLIYCGEKLTSLLSDQYGEPDKAYAFSDMPTVAECKELFAYLKGLYDSGKTNITVVYPLYKNTLVQTPCSLTLSMDTSKNISDSYAYIPDRQTVTEKLAEQGFFTVLYGKILETALGAQAATLMTMRSAYDTATEYCKTLESEIHRKRQSEVTADVIEISSERGTKGDETNVT